MELSYNSVSFNLEAIKGTEKEAFIAAHKGVFFDGNPKETDYLSEVWAKANPAEPVKEKGKK